MSEVSLTFKALIIGLMIVAGAINTLGLFIILLSLQVPK